MCTVSIVPINAGLIFTFNRDENPQRKAINFCCKKTLNNKTIYFPKDEKKGGTWFATDSFGNIVMLFNGAFIKHIKQTTYTKSRGVFILELMESENMPLFFEKTSLQNIEPFSIVLYNAKMLCKLIWDGMEKHEIILDKRKPHIFSSATLYNDNIRMERCNWLNNYLQTEVEINAESLLKFHSTYNSNDVQNGLIINREGSCATLSISQVYLTKTTSYIKHIDLSSNKIYHQQISLPIFEKV